MSREGVECTLVRRKFAGYEIIDDLGSNAWGESFRARQVSLDRSVALTVLPPEAEAPAVHALARAAASLTHPNLVGDSPVSWTHPRLGERMSRCRDHDRRIRPSSASRSWS